MIYCVVARCGDSHSQTGADLPRDASPEQECMGVSAIPLIIISPAEIDSVAMALGLTGFPVEPTPPADDSTPAGEVPTSNVAPPLEQNEVVNPHRWTQMELNVGRWTCAVVNPWTPLRIFLAVLSFFVFFLFFYFLISIPIYSVCTHAFNDNVHTFFSAFCYYCLNWR